MKIIIFSAASTKTSTTEGDGSENTHSDELELFREATQNHLYRLGINTSIENIILS